MIRYNQPTLVAEVKTEAIDGGARLALRPRKSQSVRFDNVMIGTQLMSDCRMAGTMCQTDLREYHRGRLI